MVHVEGVLLSSNVQCGGGSYLSEICSHKGHQCHTWLSLINYNYDYVEDVLMGNYHQMFIVVEFHT